MEISLEVSIIDENGTAKLLFVIKDYIFETLEEISIDEYSFIIKYNNIEEEVEHDGVLFLRQIKKQKTAQIISESTFNLVINKLNEANVSFDFSNDKKITKQTMAREILKNKKNIKQTNEVYKYYTYVY